MTALVVLAVGLVIAAASAMATLDTIASHHAARREGRGGHDTSND